ncbi:class I SAM-dependent methyltransferase [Patescibacteria group bacterium]|nr:class I SAM-dependent methyltransferase [Patescibacteria group bacterium]MBU1952088.1 class I SAM-dependent methyltransferase [Patescibacteria group bacterium]
MKKIYLLLTNLFVLLHNYSYDKISLLSVKINNGIHPKHRIINYHKFFVDNISSDDIILDLGCGSGNNTYDIAKKAKSVVGIDISQKNIEFAKSKYFRDNLNFIVGDATKRDFKQRFSKIVLSNVLEHIEDRKSFLYDLHEISDIILVRVPLINRDWLTIYKKENNFEYRLDKTHYIEYTPDTLKEELNASGWNVDSKTVQFGEVWAVAVKII